MEIVDNIIGNYDNLISTAINNLIQTNYNNNNTNKS